MRKILLILALFVVVTVNAQIASFNVAELKGITTAVRDAYTPPSGTFPIIYNTTTGQHEKWNGSTWEVVTGTDNNDFLTSVTEVNGILTFVISNQTDPTLDLTGLDNYTGAELETKLDAYFGNANWRTQDGTGTDDQTAAEVSYDNSSSSLAAAQVQAAIDEIEARVDANDAKVTNTDSQTLSFDGSNIAVSGGNSVDISSLSDGTGTDDQTAAEVTYTPSGGLVATDVQGAIDELDDDKLKKQDPIFQGTMTGNQYGVNNYIYFVESDASGFGAHPTISSISLNTAGQWDFNATGANYSGVLDFNSLTSDRVITFPDKAGTVAMTSDLTSGTVDVVSNVATSTLLGRTTAGSGDSEELTPASVRTLLNVEDGAAADQTGAEIKSAYEGESDTNAFTDAEKTKLGTVETNASADQNAGEVTVTPYVGSSLDIVATDVQAAIEEIADEAGAGGGTTVTVNNLYSDTPSGTINGVNTTFTVGQGSYQAGTLIVFQNAATYVAGQGVTETTPGSGVFDFDVAPTTGDVITARYVVPINTGSVGLKKSIIISADRDLVATDDIVDSGADAGKKVINYVNGTVERDITMRDVGNIDDEYLFTTYDDGSIINLLPSDTDGTVLKWRNQGTGETIASVRGVAGVAYVRKIAVDTFLLTGNFTGVEPFTPNPLADNLNDDEIPATALGWQGNETNTTPALGSADYQWDSSTTSISSVTAFTNEYGVEYALRVTSTQDGVFDRGELTIPIDASATYEVYILGYDADANPFKQFSINSGETWVTDGDNVLSDGTSGLSEFNDTFVDDGDGSVTFRIFGSGSSGSVNDYVDWVITMKKVGL